MLDWLQLIFSKTNFHLRLAQSVYLLRLLFFGYGCTARKGSFGWKNSFSGTADDRNSTVKWYLE
jgi:hypothetical protein